MVIGNFVNYHMSHDVLITKLNQISCITITESESVEKLDSY